MLGVLLDVSGSMEEAFAVHYDKRNTLDHDAKRAHAIVTTLNSIVKQEITAFQRNELFFACSFGLNTAKCDGVDVCDLVALLEDRQTYQELKQKVDKLLCKQKGIEEEKTSIEEQISQIRVQQQAQYREKHKSREMQERLEQQQSYQKWNRRTRGYDLLINFARKNNAPHAVDWIKVCLSSEEAGVLHDALCNDSSLTERLIRLIPKSKTAYFVVEGSRYFPYGSQIQNKVKDHEALRLARDNVTKQYEKEQRENKDAIKNIQQQEIHRDRCQQKCEQLDKEMMCHQISYCEKREQLAEIQRSYNEKYEKIDQVVIQQKPKPRTVKDVSDMLDILLKGQQSPSSSHVEEIIDSIKPYIYGKTPMVKAVMGAKEIFDDIKTEINPKILFILSDGFSTDGDPALVAQKLKHSDVIIVTCYFTSESVLNPKRLVDKENLSWNEGARALYHMSSTMPNTNAPIAHLIDYGWELPLSGECRLFVLANSLDVVEEFCKVAVSKLMQSTDALVHMLGRVSLATYINQSNEDFKPQQQIGATCYANAIAAVFHLAMHRIVDREGGIPDFRAIRRQIIQAYGKEGANTELVIKKVCSEYRLRCHKVDEKGARLAINKRCPVVVRFSWKEKQEEMFKRFYERFPKAILNASNIAVAGTV